MLIWRFFLSSLFCRIALSKKGSSELVTPTRPRASERERERERAKERETVNGSSELKSPQRGGVGRQREDQTDREGECER